MASIALLGVTKAFGNKPTLDNITLDIKEGEFVALLGPSGSGKTTLLKIVAGLLPPNAGRVLFNQVDVTAVPSRLRQAIIVFQDHSLFPHMNVFENVSFGLRARGMSKRMTGPMVREILSLVQLPDKAQSYPHELSGGERQRVALARACVLEPSVLLLDEPFSNLDTTLRLTMREFVVSLQRKLKFTCILVTHDKTEAFIMAERVAVLLDSRIEQVASPEQLYSRPESRKVAAFLGECNFVAGKVCSGVFHCVLGAFPTTTPDTDSAVGMWRYDHLALSPSAGHARGFVADRVFAGRIIEYKVVLADGTQLTVAGGSDAASVGDHVFVRADALRLHVYS